MSVPMERYENGVLVDTTLVPVPRELVNADAIRATALNALAANRTYVALATPTAAQTTAQVKALTRQMNGVIRLLLNQLDGTD